MDDVLNLISRVPIEALWPQHHPSKASAPSAERRHRGRPKTYGEAYRSLLEDRDLLALGIHRPPTGSRGEGPLSAAKASGDDDDSASYRRCPGGSRYVAISCPSASFAVRDGDCFFVLQRPSEEDRVNAPPVATASTKAGPGVAATSSSSPAAGGGDADGTTASKTETSDSSLDTAGGR